MYDNGLDSELRDLKKKIGFSDSIYKKKGHGSHYYGKYDWQSCYDEDTKNYVAHICKKDIEYFNFKYA